MSPFKEMSKEGAHLWLEDCRQTYKGISGSNVLFDVPDEILHINPEGINILDYLNTTKYISSIECMANNTNCNRVNCRYIWYSVRKKSAVDLLLMVGGVQ